MKRMKVYATLLAYEGEDVIGYVLDHLMEQNVDGFVISDNGSPDGTVRILKEKRRACRKRNIDFLLLHDSDRAWYVNEKMERLVDIVVERCGGGAAWILPIEQDEFWGAHDGPISDVLNDDKTRELLRWNASMVRPPSAAGLCGMYLYFENFIPTAEDDPTEPNPLLRMNWKVWRDKAIPEGRQQMNNARVFFPADGTWTKRFTIAGGGHAIMSRNRSATNPHPFCVRAEELFYVRHYPVRSEKQALRKYRGLKEAIEMTDRDQNKCRHARIIGAMSDEELKSWYWERYYSHDPKKDGLICDPFKGNRE